MRAFYYVIGIMLAVGLFLALWMAFPEDAFPELKPGQELSDFFDRVKWLVFGGLAVVAVIAFVVMGRQEGSR